MTSVVQIENNASLVVPFLSLMVVAFLLSANIKCQLETYISIPVKQLERISQVKLSLFTTNLYQTYQL